MSMSATWLRDTLRLIGLEVRRVKKERSPVYQILRRLEERDIGLVFDIGANSGQFAKELLSIGYKGRVVSFEPLSEPHLLLKSAADGVENWLVHSRGAIGEKDGHVDINISGNSVSSSILPMLETHELAAQNSVYVGRESTPCYKLDDVSPEYTDEKEPYFVKIDTQGYEWQVLQGGAKTIQQASGVHCELSLSPLYEGQKLWRDIIDYFEDAGLQLWSLQPIFSDEKTGRLLQVDAVFFRG